MGVLSQRIMRPGREVGQSPPTSAEVKNGGAITFTSFPNNFDVS
jgi:hypothetical protein